MVYQFKKLVKKVGNNKLYTFSINHQDNSAISIADIKNLSNKFSAKYDKVRIRGLNAQRFHTLKSMTQDDIQVDEYEEYYANKVKNGAKFDHFYQLQISVLV